VTLQLFGHAFSAYTRKTLIALDEKEGITLGCSGRAFGQQRGVGAARLADRFRDFLDHIGATTEPN
jgi:hypothetical protein